MYTESMVNDMRYEVIELKNTDNEGNEVTAYAVRDDKLSTDINADGTHNSDGALYVVTYPGGLPMVMNAEWLARAVCDRLNTGTFKASNLITDDNGLLTNVYSKVCKGHGIVLPDGTGDMETCDGSCT